MNIRSAVLVICAALFACALTGCGSESKLATEASAQAPNIITITSPEQLDETVASAKGLVLVDFWATWCPPCRFMNPILAEVATEQADTLTIAKVDVDKNRALAERYKIESIPTFILFRDGKALDMKVGAFPKDDLLKWLDANRG